MADPVHTVMIDAMCRDDEQGRDDGVTVHGDALTFDVLQQLLHAHGSVQERSLRLAPALA